MKIAKIGYKCLSSTRFVFTQLHHFLTIFVDFILDKKNKLDVNFYFHLD